MASKQRSRAAKKARAPNPLAELGLFDIPDVNLMDIDADGDSDVDESGLESELEAILSGKAPTKPTRPKKRVAPVLDIEQMAQECLKDPDDDDDNDESVLDDPELMKELLEHLAERDNPGEDTHIINETSEKIIVPDKNDSSPETTGNIISLLEQRLNLYNDALNAAKAVGDTSKARRFDRARKTLQDLLKSARSNKVINEEDIPPVVNIPKAPTRKSGSEPEKVTQPPVPSIIPPQALDKTGEIESIPCSVKVPDESENDDMKMLISRRQQYRVAALQAKKAGDKATALEYVKISKSINAVIEAIENGESVDLNNVPDPPHLRVSAADMSLPPEKEHDQMQTSSSMEAAALSAAAEPEDPAMFAAPPPPSSIKEALDQRLQKYITTKAAADAEGNSSKSRRLARIIKSYETAIKDFNAGKTVDFESLPTPPGFAPIPVSSDSSMASPSDKNVPKPAPEEKSEVKPPPPSLPVAPKRPAPQVPSKTTPQTSTQGTSPKSKLTKAPSTSDKQLQFLLERQKMFRECALSSKKSGDLQQAKEYLRLSKGFDSMIEAVKCGLPIDLATIPTPPQLQMDFVIVDASECVVSEDVSESADLIETLENDLIQQIEVCSRNKEHFLSLGDVSSASKFERLGLESKKDLSVIKHLKKTGGSPPKFHYETRLFSMVQCHVDLNENELHVTVERGINFPGKPDDLDSYVRLELPIPNDAPQKAKTHTIRDTNNPIFQEEFKFEINRKSRAQLRQFKRQSLKLEVWSKGGFLRSDTVLGTVNVKLIDLESKCTIHDSFDLFDGRKRCGGKLEVKVRIRDPLLVKQVEEVKEKWLVIGS